VERFERELTALALELAKLARIAADPAISPRLDEMSCEVLELALRVDCDSLIYDSATFVLHTGQTDRAADPNANDPPIVRLQRQ